MTRLALFLAALLAAGAAQAVCPTAQPATITATGGKISICSTEATTSVEIERNGVVQPALPIVLAPGVQADLSGYVQCGPATLRARSINAAGTGPWGATSQVFFANCTAPILAP